VRTDYLHVSKTDVSDKQQMTIAACSLLRMLHFISIERILTLTNWTEISCAVPWIGRVELPPQRLYRAICPHASFLDLHLYVSVRFSLSVALDQ